MGRVWVFTNRHDTKMAERGTGHFKTRRDKTQTAGTTAVEHLNNILELSPTSFTPSVLLDLQKVYELQCITM